MRKKKVISVITPSFNQGQFIEETIQSVLSQEGAFFIDYIIMDGGSKDKTMEMIKKYETLLKKNCDICQFGGKEFFVSRDKTFPWSRCLGVSYRWSSEKDFGQADAINKGIKKSFGSIVGWLNSDDIYYSGALKIIANQSFRNYEFCYGNGMWISKIGKNLVAYPVFKPSFYSFYYQCTLCQPAVFFTKKVFLELGALSNDYYCGFDFEYWMRALYQKKRFFFVNSFLAKSRMYFENKSLANQPILLEDIKGFKNKYFKYKKLNKIGLKKGEKINKKTHDQVARLNYLLEKGDKINLLFDATVIVNGGKKDAGRSGIFFVAWNVLKEFSKRKEINISLFCFEAQLIDLQTILKESSLEKRMNIFTDKDIENCNENIQQEVSRMDIFFSPVFKIYKRIKNNKNIFKYTIIYDDIYLACPDFFPHRLKWLEEFFIQIKSDEYYFSISENTKKDFVRHIPWIKSENIKVSPLAAADNFYKVVGQREKEEVLNKYGIPSNKKYIFSLCTLEPRKNLIFSIKGFVRFIEKNQVDDLFFVLGGSHWDKFVKLLENEIDNLEKYKDKIIKIGYVDDPDLATLFSFSEFFIYTSLYEGFGLPVLEAMKCGVPVIASNTSSLPEVAGNSALLIDPKSTNDLVVAMEKLYFDSDFKKSLAEKGARRAKLFSWEKTVDLMIEDMREKLENKVIKRKDRFFFERAANFLEGFIFFGRQIRMFYYYPKVFLKDWHYFFAKTWNKFLDSPLRQPARKVWYFIKGKN